MALQQRANGRKDLQIRSLFCERGLLERADGSAKWTQDGTSVLVGVYGPKQTSLFLEDAEQAVVGVVYTPKSGRAGSRERLFEDILRQTIEGAVLAKLHPRTIISVTVQELADDGAVLAASLNAISAALTDAGVPLRYTFGASTCCRSTDGLLLADPDSQEEQVAQAHLTACFRSRSPSSADAEEVFSQQGLLSCHAIGLLTPEELLQAKDLCQKCCDKVSSFSRLSMAKAFS